MKRPIAKSCFALAMLFATGAVHAATTTTWDLTVGDTTSAYVNGWNYSSGSKTLSVRAFYADNLTNVNGTVGDSVRNSTLETSTKNAALKYQNASGTVAGLGSFGSSGVGISNPFDGPQTNLQENATGGQHAIDNYDTNSYGTVVQAGTGLVHAHDFMLMDFNEVMTLGDFKIGYKQHGNTDIDFFVAPDTLTGAYDITGKTVAQLITAGWKQVSFSNVSDCVPDPLTPACPTQFSGGSGYSVGMKSRYIVAAGMLGGNDDAFKFASISMSTPSGGSTPVPGTIALLAAGVAAIAWNRRRT